MDEYLKQVMPDLIDIQNRPVGKDARSITLQFSNDQGSLSIPFEMLSDGEKCFHDRCDGDRREPCLWIAGIFLG
jgi:hypothetical protein